MTSRGWYSDLHIDQSMAVIPPALTGCSTCLSHVRRGRPGGVSSLVQEGFHWKRQYTVAGRGSRVLQVRVDRCGRTRNDDGRLL